MKIGFDERGREVLSDMPAAFTVPVQKRISTLDFHRQRLLEQREAMRRMIEELREENEHETFAEANDFDVDDPYDERPAGSDYELADDGLDGLDALAQREYQRVVEEARKTDSKNLNSNDSE